MCLPPDGTVGVASVPVRPPDCGVGGRPAAGGDGGGAELSEEQPQGCGAAAGPGPRQAAGDGARAGEPESGEQGNLPQAERIHGPTAAGASRAGGSPEHL